VKHREEARARALHDDLARLFAGQQRIRVSVDGHGAHWTCSVETDLRRCNVRCLDEAFEQYLTEFVTEGQIVARGRTSSPDEAGSAISKWIGNASLQELYDYRFVDRGRRFLEAFKDKALVRHPALQSSARVEIRQIVSDLHELSLRNDDRSVHVSFYGTRAVPDAYFSWDECEIFRMTVSDTDDAADVMDRWHARRAAIYRRANAMPGNWRRACVQRRARGGWTSSRPSTAWALTRRRKPRACPTHEIAARPPGCVG